ncbi:vesicular glutamate transporter 1-like [Diabrotica virgifera virgifera]|uniref:Major facilitator superfamily (MFS) profile domain-containing protein n=1 Tax=Diabrotica virgifera virgifera TaxID=50390 RepID=A0ABM5JV60_DIAVI|nr:vesicular glutamate transporter 1-like [Diabrotica virgifera virgifera]
MPDPAHPSSLHITIGRSKIPVRFWIGLMVFFTTYVNYATRVNMAIAIISMTKGKSKKTPECLLDEITTSSSATQKGLPDYGPRYDWDEHIQGIILGSYFWGYTIFSLPAGAVSELWGPARVIFWTTIVSLILNSVSVPAAHGHYGLLIACRFLIGAAGGLVYPALQVLIAKWAPPAEKGRFVAGLMGNTLATCVTWPLVGWVITQWGWNWGFHVITVQLVVFCVVFYFVCANSPEEHKFISEEEVAFIKEAQGATVTKKKHAPPYKQIFTSFPFWMLNILHFGNLWGLYLQLQSVPKFMAEVVGFSLKEAGALGALPHLMRMIFGTAYGSIGDYLKKNKVMSPKAIRKSFILASHIIPGILMICVIFMGCNWVPLIILLTFSMAINGAAVLTNLQNPQDLAPNFAGSIFGIISCIGGTTGFLVPAITGVFIQKHNGLKEWSYTFILGGCVYIGTGIIFILFGSVEEQSWNRIADTENH